MPQRGFFKGAPCFHYLRIDSLIDLCDKMREQIWFSGDVITWFVARGEETRCYEATQAD